MADSGHDFVGDLSRIEHYLQMCFPRSRAGWRRCFWLLLSRCPVHHKRLLPNDPWDSMKYGFCCDGVSYWHTGLLALHIKYLAAIKPAAPAEEPKP